MSDYLTKGGSGQAVTIVTRSAVIRHTLMYKQQTENRLTCSECECKETVQSLIDVLIVHHYLRHMLCSQFQLLPGILSYQHVFSYVVLVPRTSLYFDSYVPHSTKRLCPTFKTKVVLRMQTIICLFLALTIVRWKQEAQRTIVSNNVVLIILLESLLKNRFNTLLHVQHLYVQVIE